MLLEYLQSSPLYADLVAVLYPLLSSMFYVLLLDVFMDTDSISVADNVMLTSTVEENGRQFACEGETVTFTCQVFGTLSLQWDSPLFPDIIFPAGSTAPRSTSRFLFIACYSYQHYREWNKYKLFIHPASKCIKDICKE